MPVFLIGIDRRQAFSEAKHISERSVPSKRMQHCRGCPQRAGQFGEGDIKLRVHEPQPPSISRITYSRS